MPDQISESFKVSGFFDTNYDLLKDLPDLTNENSFDKEKFRFSRKGVYYEAIAPALWLASRIILSYLTHYAPFITRSETCPGRRLRYYTIQYIVELNKVHYPLIDMYDGIYERNAEWAVTSLEPTEDRDVVLLDFKLLQNYKQGYISSFRSILCG